MKTKSIVCVLALIGFVAGCGGGGGGSGGNNPGPGSGLQIAQQILELCAQDKIDGLLEFLAIAGDTLDGSAAFNVSGIDETTMTINWDLDTNNDMVPDIIGTIRLDDGAGMPPAVDFSPVVNNGLAGLATVLAALPDNSLVLIDANVQQQQSMITVNFSFPFVGGLPTTGTGLIDSQDADCQAQIDFSDISVLLLFTNSGIPNAPFGLTITSVDGTVTGTMTFDETNIVRIDVTLDMELFRFTLDIDTGIVAVAP